MKNRNTVFQKCANSEFSEFAANYLIERFQELQQKNEKVNIALSGGSTPLPVYELLSKANLDWNRFAFFLVDERCVPVTHDDSNFKNINKCFFSRISSDRYSMIADDLTIEESIEAYKKAMKAALDLNSNGVPSFDLILLGMGEDGHTASLFPNSKALKEETDWVVKNYVAKQDSNRITLTYPVIKGAKELVVLIKGATKNKIVDELYTSEAVEYPMHELLEANLKMNWIISE